MVWQPRPEVLRMAFPFHPKQSALQSENYLGMVLKFYVANSLALPNPDFEAFLGSPVIIYFFGDHERFNTLSEHFKICHNVQVNYFDLEERSPENYEAVFWKAFPPSGSGSFPIQGATSHVFMCDHGRSSIDKVNGHAIEWRWSIVVLNPWPRLRQSSWHPPTLVAVPISMAQFRSERGCG